MRHVAVAIVVVMATACSPSLDANSQGDTSAGPTSASTTSSVISAPESTAAPNTTADPPVTPATPASITNEPGEITFEVSPIAPSGSGRAIAVAVGCRDVCGRLVVLFHGSGLEPGSWFRGPVNVADQVGASGLADVLVVAPSRAASGDDFVEYSIDPLLDVLEASAGGLPERATFVGFSAGGDTAVRTAVASSRIEVDSVVLGASIWGLPLTNLVSPGQWKPNVLVDTGDDDGLGRLTPDIVAAFESAGVDVRVQQSPGRHNLEFVAAQMESWLRWIAEQPAT